jgi:hypothetical protein
VSDHNYSKILHPICAVSSYPVSGVWQVSTNNRLTVDRRNNYSAISSTAITNTAHEWNDSSSCGSNYPDCIWWKIALRQPSLHDAMTKHLYSWLLSHILPIGEISLHTTHAMPLRSEGTPNDCSESTIVRYVPYDAATFTHRFDWRHVHLSFHHPFLFAEPLIQKCPQPRVDLI